MERTLSMRHRCAACGQRRHRCAACGQRSPRGPPAKRLLTPQRRRHWNNPDYLLWQEQDVLVGRVTPRSFQHSFAPSKVAPCPLTCGAAGLPPQPTGPRSRTRAATS